MGSLVTQGKTQEGNAAALLTIYPRGALLGGSVVQNEGREGQFPGVVATGLRRK